VHDENTLFWFDAKLTGVREVRCKECGWITYGNPDLNDNTLVDRAKSHIASMNAPQREREARELAADMVHAL